MTLKDDKQLNTAELAKIRCRQAELAQEAASGTPCTLQTLKAELNYGKERHHDLPRHHSS
ncbi:MAG: hypothetical protein II007_12525 [Gammaproteobacteria bacterium]|nr:hypothetical protein [Gammaproteobacteria bacterium]